MVSNFISSRFYRAKEEGGPAPDCVFLCIGKFILNFATICYYLEGIHLYLTLIDRSTVDIENVMLDFQIQYTEF